MWYGYVVTSVLWLVWLCGYVCAVTIMWLVWQCGYLCAVSILDIKLPLWCGWQGYLCVYGRVTCVFGRVTCVVGRVTCVVWLAGLPV